MTTLTDEEIAALVQGGEQEQFGELVRRYEERIMRYGRRFLFVGEEVKDLVQEVFIKAYTNINSFDASRKFSSWLYRIAHNEFINGIKKRKRLPFFAFDLDTLFPHLAAKETAHGDFEQKEIRERLEGALSQLDVKYREPLMLYYLEELDYKEIADIVQIPVATVGVRLNRGRIQLKNILEKHGTPD